MPFSYQVMGWKVIEYTGKYVTVFFILVNNLFSLFLSLFHLTLYS
jgi:hypothetical protein